MTVTALMPVCNLNLVAPLGNQPTAMHVHGNGHPHDDLSGAAADLIGHGLRNSGVDSAIGARAMPGIATSTMATRTTTTRTTKVLSEQSANSNLFHALLQAYLDCRRNKRNSLSALAFEAHLERNLFEIYEELRDGSYSPGRSKCFVIKYPKPREVWAADFRDRIVHHLIYNHISPDFHAHFVADSCACIPGRGTLYAAKRLDGQVRSITQNWSRPAYYLKCDLANFFISIDKNVLLAQLLRRVTEPWWMALAETIIMHDPRSNVEVLGSRRDLSLVPHHKSLFNAPDHHGLPIGNLSSQFFANVLLNEFDQFVKHRLRAQHYVRYVDDFVLLHEDARWLSQAKTEIEAKLADLHLRLNPTKTIHQPLDRGIDFVGQIIRPWNRQTRPRTVKHAQLRLREIDDKDLRQVANSYFGLLRQASHSHNDRVKIGRTIIKRRRCVYADLTKI